MSSVQLAVPLMTVLAIAVAWGTIVESRYNADLAKIQVYDSPWFAVVLYLLWINIFLATMARWPWKKRHIGFLITHLGLLVLLIGGMITGKTGIDGQLRVVEGHASEFVVLQDLAIEIASEDSSTPRVYELKRTAKVLKGSDLSGLNEQIGDRATVTEVLPFAESGERFRSSLDAKGAGTAIGFLLQSRFFKTSEWLHSAEKKELQLGPAHLQIVEHESVMAGGAQIATSGKTTGTAAKVKSSPLAAKAAAGERLALLDRKTGKALVEFSLASLKKGPQKFGEYRVSLKRKFEEAVVGQGGTQEGGTPGKNPAVEVEIEKGGNKLRDFAYARFPTFSLNPDGVFGMSLAYMVGEGGAVAVEAAMTSSTALENSVGSPRGAGNEVVFHVFKDKPEAVRVDLFKDGTQVMSEWSEPGKTIQTPWMGMTITIGSIEPNSRSVRETAAIEPPMRSPLPPSAVRVRPTGVPDEEAFWLLEGESRRFSVRGHEYEIYFGRKVIELPFQVKLAKFSKIDYPGTQTPISYESEVHIDGAPGTVKISMNEPYKKDGYTLYQASYEMNPGEAPASIFSVNHDPGRPVKYAGSLILCLGIVVFTLMRSRFMKRGTK